MILEAFRKKTERIKAMIDDGLLDQALSMAGEMEQTKPITLAVVNAKAAVLQAMGRTHEAEACYAGMMQLYHVGAEELEAMHRLWKLAEVNHDPVWAECMHFDYCFIKNQVCPDEECATYLAKRTCELRRLEQEVLGDLLNARRMADLAWTCWTMRQHTAAAIYFVAGARKQGFPIAGSAFEPTLRGNLNLLTLGEQLMSDKYPVVVLYTTKSEDVEDHDVLARVLADMGRTVYWIKPSAISAQETAVSSISTSAGYGERGNVQIILHTAAVRNGKAESPSLEDIFNRIYEILPDRYALLIASRKDLLMLMDLPGLCRKVRLLSDHHSSSGYFDDFTAFGYLGDYTEYVGSLYGICVQEQIRQPSSVAISVIIPTRNAPASLRHTLRTCLAQEIADVEFLISDNSSPGNQDTKELVDELSDRRIRYIRPPKPLNLTRSFEYAFLQARGEFLISMGSDDGIVFGGLKTLLDVLEALPECDVIQWDRIFYVWPDAFSDRSGLFQTIRQYKRGQVNVSFYDCGERLRAVFKNPNHVGLLPMLYINSGMRRRYFQKLLDRTGQLWDGISQDVYISVVNCLINKTIPLVEYPLTIAGMGGNSWGMRCSRGAKSKADMDGWAREYSLNTIGYAVPGRLERLVANGFPDSANLYQSFLRALQTRCNPAITKDMVDWRWAFVFMMHQSAKDNLAHDQFIRLMQWAAEQHGPEFGKWFRDEVVPHAYTPPPARPASSTGGKSYTEGRLKDGGLMLNSEKLGVGNVFEAAQLFEKLLDADVL